MPGNHRSALSPHVSDSFRSQRSLRSCRFCLVYFTWGNAPQALTCYLIQTHPESHTRDTQPSPPSIRQQTPRLPPRPGWCERLRVTQTLPSSPHQHCRSRPSISPSPAPSPGFSVMGRLPSTVGFQTWGSAASCPHMSLDP